MLGEVVTHNAVLATEVKAEEVEDVEIRIGRHQATMLRHRSPQTGLDAKFSAEFAAACIGADAGSAAARPSVRIG